jgi:hypothetical protein
VNAPDTLRIQFSTRVLDADHVHAEVCRTFDAAAIVGASGELRALLIDEMVCAVSDCHHVAEPGRYRFRRGSPTPVPLNEASRRRLADGSLYGLQRGAA